MANTEVLVAKKEMKRLIGISERAGLDSDRVEMLTPLLDNLGFLKAKLDLTRAEIGSASIISTYNNGGNQQGEHINPLYKGYLDLMKAYLSGLNLLIAQLPKDAKREVIGDNVTMLQKVREMTKVAK